VARAGEDFETLVELIERSIQGAASNITRRAVVAPGIDPYNLDGNNDGLGCT
jgi:hypothetical protein